MTCKSSAWRKGNAWRWTPDLPDGKVSLQGPQGFIGVGLLQDRRLAPDRLLSDVAKQAALSRLGPKYWG